MFLDAANHVKLRLFTIQVSCPQITLTEQATARHLRELKSLSQKPATDMLSGTYRGWKRRPVLQRQDGENLQPVEPDLNLSLVEEANA